ncbi:hypothetical protein CU097_001924, partial [Rhizopus azygosporus]
MKVYLLVPKQSAFEGAKTIQTTSMPLYSAANAGPLHLRQHVMNCTYIGPTNNMTTFLNQDWSIHKSMSKNATIFIKESAWKEAAEIAQNNNAASITPYDLIYQLRPLRTRFHHRSTYFLCRASNEAVDDLAARPYTIYTLTGWDNGNDSANYRTASKHFQTIATDVICGNPRLEKCILSSLCNKLKV